MDSASSSEDSSDMGSRPITYREYQRLKEMGAEPPHNGYVLQTSGSSDDDCPPLKKKKIKGKKKGITREFTLNAQLIFSLFSRTCRPRHFLSTFCVL